jgi:hypothetical protein
LESSGIIEKGAFCVELRPFYCIKRILVPMSDNAFLHRVQSVRDEYLKPYIVKRCIQTTIIITIRCTNTHTIRSTIIIIILLPLIIIIIMIHAGGQIIIIIVDRIVCVFVHRIVIIIVVWMHLLTIYGLRYSSRTLWTLCKKALSDIGTKILFMQ